MVILHRAQLRFVTLLVCRVYVTDKIVLSWENASAGGASERLGGVIAEGWRWLNDKSEGVVFLGRTFPYGGFGLEN